MEGMDVDMVKRESVEALFKLAKGTVIRKEKEEDIVLRDGFKTGQKKKTVETVETEPSYKALEFLLTNLAPEEWKSRQNIESVERKEVDVNMSSIPDELLEQVVDCINKGKPVPKTIEGIELV